MEGAETITGVSYSRIQQFNAFDWSAASYKKPVFRSVIRYFINIPFIYCDCYYTAARFPKLAALPKSLVYSTNSGIMIT